jgi:hypothetical protein
MLPMDEIPTFFLRGLDEEDSDAARTGNRERVEKFLELQRAWDAAGLSERVSEVNLIDVHDIRAQLAGDDSHIEIRLGSQDQGKRLKDGLEVLDAQKQSPLGSRISYIDLNKGNKQALIGLTSGAHATEATQVSNPIAESSKEITPDRQTLVAASRANATAAAIKNADVTTRDRTARSSATEKKADKAKKPDQRH